MLKYLYVLGLVFVWYEPYDGWFLIGLSPSMMTSVMRRGKGVDRTFN